MLTWLRSLSTAERATLIACFLGWALDAMDTQAANLLIPSLAKFFGVNKADIGFMATATLIGSGIGGWLAGAASDRFGRVRVLQATILWFSVGSLLCGIAQTFPQLVAARIFQGIGFGGEWAVGAVLIAEMVAPQYRARAVGIVQSGYSLGVAMAAVLYFAVYSIIPEYLAWRVVFLVGVLPAALVLFVQRKVKEPPQSPLSLGATQRPRVSMLAIFQRSVIRSTLLGTLLCIALQGASFAMLIWLPAMLTSDFGLSIGRVSTFFLLQSVGAFCGYLVAATAADRLGRRASLWMFTAGAIVVTYCLCFVSLSPTVILVLAVPFGFFSLGVYSNFGPVLSELYPAHMRGAGQGFCYNIGRGVGSIFPAIAGVMAETMHLPFSVGTIAIASYVLGCFVIALLTETRGKVMDSGPVVESSEVNPSV